MLPWPDWFTTRSRPAALCVFHPGAAPALLHRTRRHAQSYTRTCTMTACAHAGARTRSRSHTHTHPLTRHVHTHSPAQGTHSHTHTGQNSRSRDIWRTPPHPTVDGAAAQTGAGALTTAARELSAAAWSSSQAPGLLKRSLSPEETPRVAGAEGGGLKHPQPGIAVL